MHLTNNIFFQARKFLVYTGAVFTGYTFTRNLLVGALEREDYLTDGTGMVDDVACYEQYVPIDYTAEHGVDVSLNLCQGSQGEGFVFPYTTCDQLDSYPFVTNTAGSC